MKTMIIDRIVHQIVVRDYMIYQKGMELRRDYFSKIGEFELESFQLNIKADEMEYRMMLLKEKIRDEESFELDDIETIIKNEFFDHHEILKEMIQNMMLVKGFEKMPEYSIEAKSELVRSYGVLVRRFYPELYPGDEDKKKIWKKVALSYQLWDLETLLRLEQESLNVNTMVNIDFHLLTQIEELLQEEVELVLEDFPYNLKELLNDDKEIENHVNNIQEQARNAKDRILSMQIETLMLLEPVSDYPS